jgi:hypothetical protein
MKMETAIQSTESAPVTEEKAAGTQNGAGKLATNGKPKKSKPAAKKTQEKKKRSKPKSKPKAKGKKSAAKKDRKGKPGKKLKEGKLLNMHARILNVLSKSKESLKTDEVAAKGKLTAGITAQYIGQLDPVKRKRFETTYLHYPTLLTLGYVKVVPGEPRKLKDGSYSETPGPAEFVITASGRKAINSEEGKSVLSVLAKKDKESKRK